jgi:hypothetical protein
VCLVGSVLCIRDSGRTTAGEFRLWTWLPWPT